MKKPTQASAMALATLLVLIARAEQLEKGAGNPLSESSLPRALLALAEVYSASQNWDAARDAAQKALHSGAAKLTGHDWAPTSP